MNIEQARAAIERVNRQASYSPEAGLLQAEKDLIEACETIINQHNALATLNVQMSTLEEEIATMRNQMKAVEDEAAQLREDLRYLCGVKS